MATLIFAEFWSMSPEQITALCTGLASILAAMVAAFQARAASKHAQKSVEVTNQGNQEVGKVRVLVNGANLLLLKELAATKRRVAGLTGLVADRQSADEADRVVKDHDERQNALSRSGS